MLKRYGLILVVILGSVALFRDASHLAVSLQLLAMAAAVLVVGLGFFDRRSGWGIFPEVDLAELVRTACRRSVGAAIVFAAIIALLCTLLLVTRPAHGSTMDLARPHLPVLRATIERHWPDAPLREAFAGQVEQESGWKTQARLHTSREDGYGLCQLTVTYKTDGSERFNILRDAARLPALRSWDWQADPFNVRYQLTFLVLTDRANFRTMAPLFATDLDRWAAGLVAYNAGPGTVLQRRALARVQAPQRLGRWFGGLDGIRLPYESRKLYGRDLGAMRNDYPRLILQVRAPKYRGLL